MVLVEGASRDEGYSGLDRHDLETRRQRPIFATVCTDEICQNQYDGTMTYTQELAGLLQTQMQRIAY